MSDNFFKETNYIDADVIEDMFSRLEFKLDKISRQLGKLSSGTNSTSEPKVTTEIPEESKTLMKDTLEKHSDVLSQFEQGILKDLSGYPRWTEKQKNIFEKILKEIPERK